MMKRIYQTVGSLLLCGVMTSCADVAGGLTKGVLDKVMEDDPPKVVLRIKSGGDLNPDPMGRPSPIVVRLYELKTNGNFDNADFFALYEEDATILGEDMNAREEMEVSPNENLEIAKELNIETRFLGVMAAYRDLDNAVWRGTIETPVDETTYVDIGLGSLTLSVQKGEKKGGWLGF